PPEEALREAVVPLVPGYTAGWGGDPDARGPAGRAAYETRLAAALAYHWWRFDRERSRPLEEVVGLVRAGRLIYKDVKVDVLREVALAEGFGQFDLGATKQFRADYVGVIAAAARGVGGRWAEQELEGFEAELIVPREDRP